MEFEKKKGDGRKCGVGETGFFEPNKNDIYIIRCASPSVGS